MNVVLVAYRWTPTKEDALRRLIRGWCSDDRVLIVENHPNPNYQSRIGSTVAGTNQFAEFSGYLEGLNKVSLQGPILILNDTALAHHSITFWRIQIRTWMRLGSEGIFGDPRSEQIRTEYGVLRYYASWIFWIPTPNDFEQFRRALEYAISNWDIVFSPNPHYRTFLATYLRGSIFHGWKNAGLRDQKAQDVKIRCIWAEHRLSQTLWSNGVKFEQLTGSHVAAMRGLDRLYSFRRRAQSFLK